MEIVSVKPRRTSGGARNIVDRNLARGIVDKAAGTADFLASTTHGFAMFPFHLGSEAIGYALGGVLPGYSGKELAEKYGGAVESVTLQPGMISAALTGGAIKPEESFAQQPAELLTKGFEFFVPTRQMQEDLARMKELGVPEGVADQAAFWLSKFTELLAFKGYHTIGSGTLKKLNSIRDTLSKEKVSADEVSADEVKSVANELRSLTEKEEKGMTPEQRREYNQKIVNSAEGISRGFEPRGWTGPEQVPPEVIRPAPRMDAPMGEIRGVDPNLVGRLLSGESRPAVGPGTMRFGPESTPVRTSRAPSTPEAPRPASTIETVRLKTTERRVGPESTPVRETTIEPPPLTRRGMEEVERTNLEGQAHAMRQRTLSAMLEEGRPKDARKTRERTAEESKPVGEEGQVETPEGREPIGGERPVRVRDVKEDRVAAEPVKEEAKPIEELTPESPKEEVNRAYEEAGKVEAVYPDVEAARANNETLLKGQFKTLAAAAKKQGELLVDPTFVAEKAIPEIIKVGDKYRLVLNDYGVTPEIEAIVKRELSSPRAIPTKEAVEASLREAVGEYFEQGPEGVRVKDGVNLDAAIKRINDITDQLPLAESVRNIAETGDRMVAKLMEVRGQRQFGDPTVKVAMHPLEYKANRGVEVVYDSEGRPFDNMFRALEWMDEKGLKGRVEATPFEDGWFIELGEATKEGIRSARVTAKEASEKIASMQDVKDSMVREETTTFDLDKTNILPTLLKDIANQNPARTMVYELLQNSLDAMPESGRVDIVIGSDVVKRGKPSFDSDGNLILSSNMKRISTLDVTDTGHGMTPQEVKKFFLVGGSIGKTGTTTRGGYGLAKIALLLIPDRIKLTTVKDGIKTVVETNRDQVYNGEIKIRSEPTARPNGTTFSAKIPEEFQGKMVGKYELELAANKVVEGIWTNHDISINGKPRVVVPLSQAEAAAPPVKWEHRGSVVTLHTIKTEKYGRSWSGTPSYYVDGMVTNKGLVVDIPSHSFIDGSMKTAPDFKFVLNFEHTPSVRDPAYPFLKNRTELVGEIIARARASTKRIIDLKKLETVVTKGKEFKEMYDKSPTLPSGIKVLIPYKGESFNRAKAVLDKHLRVFSDFSSVMSNFTNALKRSGEAAEEFHITIDPNVYGFKSHKEITGVEAYAINPFNISKKRANSRMISRLPADQINRAMGDLMTHALTHEFAHKAKLGHDAAYASELGRVITAIGHRELANIASKMEKFYERHGDAIERIVDDFEFLRKSGDRLKESLGGSEFKRYGRRRASSAPSIEAEARPSPIREGYLDGRSWRDILQDVKELAKDERGSISLEKMAPEKLEIIRRLAKDAARAGKKVAEFLIEAGYEARDARLIEEAAKQLDKRDSVREPSYNMELKTGPDVSMVKPRRVKGRVIRNQPVYLGEALNLRDVVSELDRAPSPRWGPEVAWVTFQKAGGVVQDIYYTYRGANKVAKGKIKAEERALAALEKGLSRKSKERIMKFAIGVQEGGATILADMGRKGKNIPLWEELTPREQRTYTELRKKYENLLEYVNDIRVNNGKRPITGIKDYFTFIHTMSFMDRLNAKFREGKKGVDVFHNLTEASPEIIMDAYAQWKNVPFRFEKHRISYTDEKGVSRLKERLGGSLAIDLDPINVYRRYMRTAINHAEISPIVNKIAMLRKGLDLGDKTPSGKTKPYVLGRDKPKLDSFLVNWSNRIAGKTLVDPGRVATRRINNLRKDIAGATLAFNLRSYLVQFSAFKNSYSALGEKFLSQGVYDALDYRKFKDALKESDLLETRFSDESIAAMMNDVKSGKLGSAKRAATLIGFWPLAMTDLFTATATYLGAKRMAYDLGLTGRAAKIFADNIVEKTQGSSLPGSLSPIQSHAIGKLVTLFGTFAINDWNYMTREVLGLGNNRVTKRNASTVARYLIGTAAVSAIYKYGLKAQSPEMDPIGEAIESIEDDDAWWEFARRVGMEFVERIPVVGGGLRYGSHPLGAPAQYAYEIARIAANDPAYAKVDKVLELVGKLRGIPSTSQMVKSYRAAKRGEDPWGIAIGSYEKDKGGKRR